jgi:serine/threonine protein kinase
MLTGFTPFTGVSKQNLAENVQAGEYFIPKTVKLSLQGLDFLNSCLKFDTYERCSMIELLQHPYISCNEQLESGGDISEQLYLSYMPGAADKGNLYHQKVQQNPTAWA